MSPLITIAMHGRSLQVSNQADDHLKYTSPRKLTHITKNICVRLKVEGNNSYFCPKPTCQICITWLICGRVYRRCVEDLGDMCWEVENITFTDFAIAVDGIIRNQWLERGLLVETVQTFNMVGSEYRISVGEKWLICLALPSKINYEISNF